MLPAPGAAGRGARADARRAPPARSSVNLLVPTFELDVLVEVARRARLVDLYHGPVDAEIVGVIKRRTAPSPAGRSARSTRRRRPRQPAATSSSSAAPRAAAACTVADPLRPLLDEVIAAVRHPRRRRRRRGTAEQVAELLDAGAAGVRGRDAPARDAWSRCPRGYKRAVVDAGPGSTTLTDAFHVLWPDPAAERQRHRLVHRRRVGAARRAGRRRCRRLAGAFRCPASPPCRRPRRRGAHRGDAALRRRRRRVRPRRGVRRRRHPLAGARSRLRCRR